MKNLILCILPLFFLLPLQAISQNDCQISGLTVNDVHSCTNTTYVYELSISIANPIGDDFKIYYKELPNGNSTFAGIQSYQSPNFNIHARRNMSYAIYVFDAEDASCYLRDTLPPQFCMSPCKADSLELSTVSCYPGSNQLELRFEYPSYDFNGGFLYEVFDDTSQIRILWMAPWGTITIPQHYEGDTLLLCQIDDSLCCKEFVVPMCNSNNYICPIYGVAPAVADSCINGKVSYRVGVEHAPALDNRYTELEILDEQGQFIKSVDLEKNETAFFIDVDESTQDRTFTICDIHQVCCTDLLVPAASCDPLLSSTDIKNSDKVSIYPNPASSHISFRLPGNESITSRREFRIYDLFGRIVKSGIVSQDQERIFIGDLVAGHYIIEFNSNKDKGYRGRFIRIHE